MRSKKTLLSFCGWVSLVTWMFLGSGWGCQSKPQKTSKKPSSYMVHRMFWFNRAKRYTTTQPIPRSIQLKIQRIPRTIQVDVRRKRATSRPIAPRISAASQPTRLPMGRASQSTRQNKKNR